LPDSDGRAGKIEVSSSKGSIMLNKQWQSSEVVSGDKAPGEPVMMEEKQVREIFSEALAAQPEAPAVFLMYFESEGVKPKVTSLALLPAILKTIKDRKSTYISVVGHTDSMGTVDYNSHLSLKRAKTVAEILVSNGVDQSVIEIDYYGKEKALIITPDGVPEPRNRRVEIIIR
jgi:outer membrane protein OmpA-like peptidoglycan-associated protein